MLVILVKYLGLSGSRFLSIPFIPDLSISDSLIESTKLIFNLLNESWYNFMYSLASSLLLKEIFTTKGIGTLIGKK